MKKINCVVAGLGRVGFELNWDKYREKPCTHTQAILEHPRTQLIAGIESDLKKRRAFTHKCFSPAYPDWKTFLDHHHLPDILFISTPTSVHGKYLRIALKYNLPIAVVEKPITSHYREALSLLKDYQKTSTRVVVNHERRFADDYRHVKKIIEDKKYGDLLSLQGHLFTGVSSPYESLHHDGTHLLDIAAFLTESSLKKTSSVQIENLIKYPNPKKDRSLRFSMTLNTIPCYFEVGGDKQFFHFEIHLIFQKGMIRIGNDIYREWKAEPSHLYQDFISLQPQKKKFPKTRYFSNMVQHVVTLFDQPKLPSQSTLEDALLVFKISQALKSRSNIDLNH